jgi:hypothetical protein
MGGLGLHRARRGDGSGGALLPFRNGHAPGGTMALLWWAFVAIAVALTVAVAKFKTDGAWRWRWGRDS